MKDKEEVHLVAKKQKRKLRKRGIAALLLTFITVLLFSTLFVVLSDEGFRGKTLDMLEHSGAPVELKIPEEFIPVYQSAAKEYGIEWQLLAAHHRVETRFSTMDTLISPVGAEGHMQVRP
ncbi:hypothetical protein [Jeotgalibacillus malaysiensis]|uniref:hypothetical protein n=1 Tax=Jeotgalibacillus malaysiensis TaxID=1508404 RepID=UPI00384F329F